MAKKMIKVKNLSKQYQIGGITPYFSLRESLMGIFKKKDSKNKFWALKNVNFEVQEGEVLGIIGANGAGKSTLLKILSQITLPTTGHIGLNGRVASLLEVGTGFHPELTGRENIYLNGAILGMTRQEIKGKFDDIVAFAEIGKFLDTPVKHYSSGMYVRLAFAVAAYLEPEILIIDEVLSVGDARFQEKCLGKMEDVSKSGRTVLFVSHNLAAVNRLCKKCLLLDQGKIKAYGKTHEVIKKYLERGKAVKADVKFSPDLNKAIHLRRVKLLNTNNKLANTFEYKENINIVIDYEVNKKIDNVSVWLGISTIEGEIVLASADTDFDNNLRGIRLSGLYQSVFQLPQKWLNAGQYRLVVGIMAALSSNMYDREEITHFKILDIGLPEPGRPGHIQPMILWKTHKL